MDSLYPSLVSAILMIGWAPSECENEQQAVLRDVIWFALGYIIVIVTKFLFVRIDFYWLFLDLGCLWILWRSVVLLGLRVWPSILTSYILALAYLQVLNWYPFISWKGIPTTYLIGFVWFLCSVSVGPEPEQKHLVLGLAYFLVTKLQMGSLFSHPDDLLTNSFWIGLALVSLFIRIQTAFQSKLSPLRPGM